MLEFNKKNRNIEQINGEKGVEKHNPEVGTTQQEFDKFQ